VGLRFQASMANEREELGIEAGETGQVFGVGIVCLAGAAVDQTQLAGVGNQDLMPELGEQAAGSTRVGAGLHGYPAEWQAGELAPESRLGGWVAGFLDEVAPGTQRV